jgi:hypothetical protein
VYVNRQFAHAVELSSDNNNGIYLPDATAMAHFITRQALIANIIRREQCSGSCDGGLSLDHTVPSSDSTELNWSSR